MSSIIVRMTRPGGRCSLAKSQAAFRASIEVARPEKALVLCVDKKSQIQAPGRSQPLLPMWPGQPQRRTHDYFRHGTTSLFAAFNVADGNVISSMHRRHRSNEFKKFLAKIDREVPQDLDVHLVCDNYGTHKHRSVIDWLDKHPRFHRHFTPTYSSWLNQVERFFAYVTADLRNAQTTAASKPSKPTSATGSKPGTRTPNPFIWTKTAEEILTSLGRLIQRTTGAGH